MPGEIPYDIMHPGLTESQTADLLMGLELGNATLQANVVRLVAYIKSRCPRCMGIGHHSKGEQLVCFCEEASKLVG